MRGNIYNEVMGQTDIRGYIALSLVDGVGPIRYRKILEIGGDPESILREHPETVEMLIRKPLPDIDVLFNRADEEIKKAREMNMEIIPYPLDGYPEMLRHFDYAPPIIYAWGNTSLLHEVGIAIVGSRKATPYGKRVARMFAMDLSDLGFVVISGGARGIDTVAHRATLSKNGKTIVVLGSGLDVPYPAENKKLFKEVAEKGGCVITEFPFGTKPNAENFPQRNRIISGLSLATVVIEAGKTSGALITARWALEQGKEVLAVPGPIDSPLSSGTNRLIKMGAHIATSVQDILEELGIRVEPKKIELPHLTDEETRVFRLIGNDPVHLEELSEKLNQTPFILLETLLSLELKGVIEQLPGKYFVRNPVYAESE